MQPFEALRNWRRREERSSTAQGYPPYQHLEHHFNAAEIVKDIILGLSDGLTVPFALAAGLSSLGNSKLVIYGGVAELVSGSISMGLGGYLAARSELDHYDTERAREALEVQEVPADEEQEIIDIMAPYGLDQVTVQPIIEKLRSNPDKFVDFMMRFELNLEAPNPRRSMISGLTIGLSYLFGGLIPLLPYFFLNNAYNALYISIGVTLTTLLVFGYIKSILVSPKTAFKGAIQTLIIGAVAAGASFGIVKALPSGES
ncbi:hypothetical protein INT43_004411 [Umbelopsis isabellina]|uniref:DUF125-domain-containing protein n=1 Tax=Mortierella isabellina TaxID=91625 RepID=A0A8H7PIC6_MORIS|nr:hypothetical protein INT43_004411 [Umbelopsis isabellina]